MLAQVKFSSKTHCLASAYDDERELDITDISNMIRKP
jgi:hypothetical protein